ncbi:YiiX/YebB-like N1pC/P60 family cysteine hydrolase [Candidatus Viridilinea mediisalina]|uniref:YiiX/YebB-like N1pC/P60 family cysteine hydrolase n=1 Tax=Candidatus Viridilinea mediisalina TaxID=2024553 RepID=UPI0013FE01EE|nr:YiiX/YebB-like N1pC/P60 family cysteine hydrolase [Candidatus Viridilinea mediisalina]
MHQFAKNTFRILFILSLLFFNSASVYVDYTRTSLAFNPDQLQTGDIILRQGRSAVSQMVMSIDQESLFSHSGIIYRDEDGITYVIHAIPYEEGALDNKNSYVRKDVITSFLRADRAQYAAVYRVKDNSSEIGIEAANAALIFFERMLVFDLDFDLGKDDQLYCTELVWRAYLAAGVDLVDGTFDYLALPFYHGSYILPSRLANSRWLDEIVLIE